MKKCLCLLTIIILFIILCSCANTSQGNNNATSTNTSISNNKNTTTTSKNTTDNDRITANIVKSGTLKDMNVECENAKISIELWDLGNTGSILQNGAEVLCVKFRVTNKSENQIAIQGLFNTKVFIDGVEINKFGSDFYGNGKSFKIFEDTLLKGGAETDIYFCYDCTIEDSHKIEVEIYNGSQYDEESGFYYAMDDNETPVKTFAFNIE